MTEHEIIDSFSAAIMQAGITPPDSIEADGDLHRFSTNGRRNDKAGYYVLHLDGVPAGLFGCWRSGIERKWRADLGRPLSASEIAQMSARAAEQAAIRDAHRQAESQAAADVCSEIWSAASPAKKHAYLQSKGITSALGCKVIDGSDPCVDRMFWSGDSWLSGALLLIPICDGTGDMVSLQAIDEHGAKSFARKGRKRGGFHLIGDINERGTILLGEGLATVWAALQMIDGSAFGAVAFDAGNLEVVAKTLRLRFPSATIIVLSDVDENQRGEMESKKAAQAVRGIAWKPEFSLRQLSSGMTDFWDMWNDKERRVSK